jgi:hydroxyethylthiazole kinase-like uncharacterized protein yjeF
MQGILSLQENSMATARIPVITQKQVVSFVAPRPRDSHKGQFGTVAVIGGNNGMIGAALLAGRAALKLGAGCVHVGLLADNTPGVDTQQVELMLHQAKAALQLPKLDVLAIGCGMGTDLAAQKILHDALKLEAILVLDADALNMIAMRPDLRSMLATRKAASIATPHPGEAARLLGISTEGIQSARTASAQELAKRLNCSIVLKGANSLCITREGKIWLNNTGNPGMSSPGMGDVLSGMIAAFIAQEMSVDHAMLLAVHLHGAAGDALAEQQASIGMTASEVSEWARWLLNQWIK